MGRVADERRNPQSPAAFANNPHAGKMPLVAPVIRTSLSRMCLSMGGQPSEASIGGLPLDGAADRRDLIGRRPRRHERWRTWPRPGRGAQSRAPCGPAGESGLRDVAPKSSNRLPKGGRFSSRPPKGPVTAKRRWARARHSGKWIANVVGSVARQRHRATKLRMHQNWRKIAFSLAA